MTHVEKCTLTKTWKVKINDTDVWIDQTTVLTIFKDGSRIEVKTDASK